MSHIVQVEQVLLVEGSSLAFPPLSKIGQQIPGDWAMNLAVDVMPRLSRPCTPCVGSGLALQPGIQVQVRLLAE